MMKEAGSWQFESARDDGLPSWSSVETMQHAVMGSPSF
jgi:hypothetical protein